MINTSFKYKNGLKNVQHLPKSYLSGWEPHSLQHDTQKLSSDTKAAAAITKNNSSKTIPSVINSGTFPSIDELHLD